MPDRPNILIITTDQQHHAMMSCAGNEYLHTPNMDRIAADGVRFGRAYAGNPVCMPQRFSWWTGRMPSSLGIRSNAFPHARVPDVVHEQAMGHIARRAGYQTFFGGKIHLPGDLTPESAGFTYYCADERDRLAVESSTTIHELDGSQDPWLMAVNLINPHDICYQAIRAFADNESDQRILANGAVEVAELDEVLGSAPRDRTSGAPTQDAPAAREPQTRVVEGQPAAAAGRAALLSQLPPLPANHMPQEDEPAGIQDMLDQRGFRKSARAQWGEYEWRLHRWAYHRLTERVDNQVGVVLDALESSGQLENTVVIFTSDHGDHDSSHKLEHKSIFYDEAARVPLIVQDPDLPNGVRGSVVDAGLVQTGIDLLATVCDYAGADLPEHNLGMSFRSAANGTESRAPLDGAYGENELSYMYVTERYKFVRYDEGKNARQLYDLEKDPRETRNWIGDPGMDVIAAGLEAELDADSERHRHVAVM